MTGGGPADGLLLPEKVDNSQGGCKVDQDKIVRNYEQTISHTSLVKNPSPSSSQGKKAIKDQYRCKYPIRRKKYTS